MNKIKHPPAPANSLAQSEEFRNMARFSPNFTSSVKRQRRNTPGAQIYATRLLSIQFLDSTKRDRRPFPRGGGSAGSMRPFCSEAPLPHRLLFPASFVHNVHPQPQVHMVHKVHNVHKITCPIAQISGNIFPKPRATDPRNADI